MKRCTKCGISKPFEAFTKHKLGRDGLRPRCRECTAAANAVYRARNQDKIKAYNATYRVEHVAERAAYNRKWLIENRGRANENSARWKKLNPEKMRPGKRAWNRANPDKVRRHKQTEYERHREKIIQRVAAWRVEKPDLRLAQHRKRRSLQAGAAGANYTTAAMIAARFDLYGSRCYYCDQEDADSVDHRIPLARGGSHWPANLVPCCRRCNSSKNAKTETEFLKLDAA